MRLIALALVLVACGDPQVALRADAMPTFVPVAPPPAVVVEIPEPPPPLPFALRGVITLRDRAFVIGAVVTDPTLTAALDRRARYVRPLPLAPRFYRWADRVRVADGEPPSTPVDLTIVSSGDTCVTRAVRGAFVQAQATGESDLRSSPFREALEIEGCRDFLDDQAWLAVTGPSHVRWVSPRYGDMPPYVATEGRLRLRTEIGTGISNKTHTDVTIDGTPVMSLPIYLDSLLEIDGRYFVTDMCGMQELAIGGGCTPFFSAAVNDVEYVCGG